MTLVLSTRGSSLLYLDDGVQSEDGGRVEVVLRQRHLAVRVHLEVAPRPHVLEATLLLPPHHGACVRQEIQVLCELKLDRFNVLMNPLLKCTHDSKEQISILLRTIQPVLALPVKWFGSPTRHGPLLQLHLPVRDGRTGRKQRSRILWIHRPHAQVNC